MPLRIAIDCRRVRDFGVGTYIRNLVRRLGEIDATNNYLLIAPEERAADFAGLPANFETRDYKQPGSGWLARLRFSWFLRGLGADLIHIPLSVVPPLMPRPYVVTVHDLGGFIFDKVDGLRKNLRFSLFRRGLMRAERVIAVSNSTRRDVETLLDIPATRIRTIYSAPDPLFLDAGPAIACIGEDGYTYSPRV